MRRSKSQENLQRVRASSNLNMPSSPSASSVSSPHSSRMPMLSEKELREHFNMPLNEVAKKYGMCTTALKKLCRKYGVMQWPHRKLRSLEKKIASLRAEQRYTTDGRGHLDDEIRKLEIQRESLVTGNDDAVFGEAGEAWSPQASPDDDGEAGGGGSGAKRSNTQDVESRLLMSGVGGAHASASGGSGGWEGGAGGGAGGDEDERVSKLIVTLEEENASLRALSRSLMKERQELLKRTQATGNELAELRRTCDSLNAQLHQAKHQHQHQHQQPQQHQQHHQHQEQAPAQATQFYPQLPPREGSHDSSLEIKPALHKGPNGVQQAGGNGMPSGGGMVWAAKGSDAGVGWGGVEGYGEAGGDLSALSWMAPDFDLEDLV
eukprot:CAMPEP_0172016500 /NCGR_PEP_ID=MMETSP1041-20130122/11056_1 /TAXON_ID=464988 /ORGANISM="Hemiselmis andersenii, Strain CCMP439" /LENGTH=376 /DNA_ID=CAMNT_0012671451 /DNA_START=444 /DNA_END=1574 /DNA_ORIENTATION=+